MKEGYLQTKIAEINEKCNQIEQTISMETSKIRLLQQRVGNFKVLLKKLNDLQDFKKQMIRQINSGNEKIIVGQIEKLSYDVADIINSTIDKKAQKLTETLDYLKRREEEINNQKVTILQQAKNIKYLLEHNNLLMMKLVNKGVLSDREVNELHRRATNKPERV